MYTVYDFGDFDSSGKMGNPYVKLLSLIDPSEASVDFHNLRGGTPNNNITYNAASTPGGGQVVTVSLSDELIKTLNTVGTYFPALLAIVALNALVVLVLLAGGIVYLIRRRSRGGVRRRVGLGRTLTPMPGQHGGGSSYDMPNIEPHQYQPVSMALTEDTFVPPSAPFSKGDRPKSVA